MPPRVDYKEGDLKFCKRCNQRKPLSEFKFNKGLPRKDGTLPYQTFCKACQMMVSEIWAKRNRVELNRRNRERRKRINVKMQAKFERTRKKYGIGELEFTEMYRSQNGMCAICHKREATHVDHNHKTGAVRGLLCNSCNAGMGNFKDDPEVMKEAINYLLSR